MNQICIYCDRRSPDRNLWCQETYCAAESSPIVLNYGEQMGDLKIVKPLTVLRTSILYKATQAGVPVLLKLAHEGHHEQLQREARFLMELREDKKVTNNDRQDIQKLARNYPMLPVLLPPYRGEQLSKHYYGKTVFRERSHYYTLFKDVQGEPLRTLLMENPQPWYQHVGLMMVGVADAIALMHSLGVYHLCLTPDQILVHIDKEGIPRPTIIDLGATVDAQSMNVAWKPWLTPLAYRPPEAVQSDRLVDAEATDVYGMGYILYELLAGRPVYEFRHRSDAEIRHSVLQVAPAPINRPDLAEIPDIAEQAVSKNYRQRQPDALTFLAQLQQFFPFIPKQKPPRRINWRQVAIVAGVLAAIMMMVVLALSF